MSVHENPSSGDASCRSQITKRDLPPVDTKRWVASRKAAVVAAIRQNVITEEEACRRYGLSMEELDSWRSALDEYGVGALRATRLQLYRS
jgi:transposase-like protein